MPMPKETGFGLINNKGEIIPCSEENYRSFLSALRVLEGGKSEGETDRLLTTGEVGEILGVSAKTVARMLDAGAMESLRLGTSERSHRRVRMSEALAYKARQDAATAAAMNDLLADAAQSGLYDIDVSDYLSSLEG